MRDLGKHRILGVGVNAVDYAAATARIISAAEERRAYSVTALAVHGVVIAARDPLFRAQVNAMDLVTPDGQPVRWALNQLHGVQLPDRVRGPDLTLAVLSACRDRALPVFFYGSRPEVLAALVESAQSKYQGLIVAGARPSRFREVDQHELEQIADSISASGARVVFVGLGCPRQEVFTQAVHSLLAMPVLAVGAAFDFHAGLLKEAPPWMQRRGLEWLFRLASEPRRLFRRYAVTNSYFVAMWAWQAICQYRRYGKLVRPRSGNLDSPAMDAKPRCDEFSHRRVPA